MCDYMFNASISDVLQTKENGKNANVQNTRNNVYRQIRDLLYQEEKAGNILPSERFSIEMYLDAPATILKEKEFFQIFFQHQHNETLSNCFSFCFALGVCEHVKSLFQNKEQFVLKEYSLSGVNYNLGTLYFKSGKKHIPILLYQFQCKQNKWTLEFNFYDFASEAKQNITRAELQDLGASMKTIQTIGIHDFIEIQHLQQAIVASFQMLIFPNILIKKGQIQNHVSYDIVRDFKDAKTRYALKKELDDKKDILKNNNFPFLVGYVYHINPKRIYKGFQKMLG